MTTLRLLDGFVELTNRQCMEFADKSMAEVEVLQVMTYFTIDMTSYWIFFLVWLIGNLCGRSLSPSPPQNARTHAHTFPVTFANCLQLAPRVHSPSHTLCTKVVTRRTTCAYGLHEHSMAPCFYLVYGCTSSLIAPPSTRSTHNANRSTKGPLHGAPKPLLEKA